MRLHGQEKSPFSVQRSFVVQFRLETDVKQGPFEGRAEHVPSGQHVHFHSLDGLLAFIDQILNAASCHPLPGRADSS